MLRIMLVALVLLAVAISRPGGARAQLSVETYDADTAFTQCVMRTLLKQTRDPCAAEYAAFCEAHRLDPGTCGLYARQVLVDVITTINGAKR